MCGTAVCTGPGPGPITVVSYHVFILSYKSFLQKAQSCSMNTDHIHFIFSFNLQEVEDNCMNSCAASEYKDIEIVSKM